MNNQEISSRTAAALQELFTVWGACPQTGGSPEVRSAGQRAVSALALIAKADRDRRNNRSVANRRHLQRIAANRPW